MPGWSLALVPVYEIVLGGWLLSRRWRFGAWLAALATLSVFALVTLEAVSAGRSSCGCLGAASPLPGVMLAIDVVFLALFLLQRPGWGGWPAAGPELQTAATMAAVVAVVFAAAGAFATLRYGSIAVALADARGDALAASPRAIDAGLGEPGSQVERQVTLRNLSETPVTIEWLRVKCDCVEHVGLPKTLEPNGECVVTVRVRLPRSPGPFVRGGAFQTSTGNVPFGIRGEVLPGAE